MNAAEPNLVKDINPGWGGSIPRVDAILGDRLVFSAYTSAQGRELWISDGTSAGTEMLKDIYPGSEGSDPIEFLPWHDAAGEGLFFMADDGVHGNELWKTDGTPDGTVLFKDIRPGPDGSLPASFTPMGNRFYFLANDGTHGQELWMSDGTPEGTALFKDLYPGPERSNLWYLTVLGERLIFQADNGTHGREIWMSDGTPEGTAMVQDIHPGEMGSAPRLLTAAGDKIFFLANDGVHGEELWVSDGTAGGTVMVREIKPGEYGPAIYWLFAFNGQIFFSAAGESSFRSLWRSDGTPEGTVLVFEIPTSDNLDWQPTVVGDRIFFTPDNGLWVTDGTSQGTALVMEFSSREPQDLTAIGDRLYFAADDGIHGWELWSSDGTSTGTYLVHDLKPGREGSLESNAQLYVYPREALFFTANAGLKGTELWMLSLGDDSPFRRGDVDRNGAFDVTDAIVFLNYQFVGSVKYLHCLDAADVDDSGELDVSDALRILNSLLLSTAPPPAFPGPFQCGQDGSPDDLGCSHYEGCWSLVR